MKKLLVMMVCSMLLTTAFAGNDIITKDIKKLPAMAQRFIGKYFPGEKISQIKIDKDLLKKDDFDVVLENGTEIDFDAKGEWKDIDCKQGVVPSDLVPAKIAEHVKKEFPGKSIRSISKDSKDYELKLSDGMELKYNLKGDFLGID